MHMHPLFSQCRTNFLSPPPTTAIIISVKQCGDGGGHGVPTGTRVGAGSSPLPPVPQGANTEKPAGVRRSARGSARGSGPGLFLFLLASVALGCVAALDSGPAAPSQGLRPDPCESRVQTPDQNGRLCGLWGHSGTLRSRVKPHQPAEFQTRPGSARTCRRVATRRPRQSARSVRVSGAVERR
jgi:hypothetical protein